jgi:tRNA(fMet)-specific endonuclease VapC
VIVFDSDVAIDVLRGIEPAVAWFHGLADDEQLVVPGYVAMEVVVGTKDGDDLEHAQRWLARCDIVWLDPLLSAEALKKLSQYHLQNAIGVLDVLIAQVAISLKSPLYTFNQKHFSVVADLETIRPYSR